MSNIQTLSVFSVSNMDGLTPTDALLKIGEEYGELCAAHLNKENKPNKSASSSPNVEEEAVDLLICVLDYLNKSGFSAYDINEMIDKKVPKWKAKVERSFK